MNEPLAACPDCAARRREIAESDGGPATCARCRPTSRIPATASSSGEHASAGLDGDDDYAEVACPDCGAALRVRAKYVGRHVRCGGCRAKFLVRADTPSALDGPPPGPAGAAATPDPDDPWQGRAEVLRLLGEVSRLRAENDDLRAKVERLERGREVATRELARLRAEAARDARRGEGAVTFRFLDEAARASGA